GFDSVRRFNALFRSHYRLTPSTLRRSSVRPAVGDCLRLTIAYRPPLDWHALLRFLSARALFGVEGVPGHAYPPPVRMGPHRGWLSVPPIPGRNPLPVDLPRRWPRRCRPFSRAFGICSTWMPGPISSRDN